MSYSSNQSSDCLSDRWIEDTVSCYHYGRSHNNVIKKMLIDQLLDKADCLNLLPSKVFGEVSGQVASLISMDINYSKLLKWMISHPPVDNCNLSNYQFEELINEDLSSPRGYFFKAKHIPSKTDVYIKFFYQPSLPSFPVRTRGNVLWGDISRWYLKNRVLPNVDVILDNNMYKPCNLSLESRFTKHLLPYPTSAYWFSTAATGATLHEYLDDPSLGILNLFEICRSLDFCMDVWQRTGLIHGQLTVDTVRICKLSKMYRYTYEGISINTRYLPVPVAFDLMAVVDGSIIHSKLVSNGTLGDIEVKSEQYSKKYDYNTFYLSLLYYLVSSGDDTYKDMREYLINSELAPLYTINKENDFKLQSIFQVDKSAKLFEGVRQGLQMDGDGCTTFFRLGQPSVLDSSISASKLINSYLSVQGQTPLTNVQKWTFGIAGTAIATVILANSLANVSNDLATIGNNTSSLAKNVNSSLSSLYTGFNTALTNVLRWSGLIEMTPEQAKAKLANSSNQDDIVNLVKSYNKEMIDIIIKARSYISTSVPTELKERYDILRNDVNNIKINGQDIIAISEFESPIIENGKFVTYDSVIKKGTILRMDDFRQYPPVLVNDTVSYFKTYLTYIASDIIGNKSIEAENIINNTTSIMPAIGNVDKNVIDISNMILPYVSDPNVINTICLFRDKLDSKDPFTSQDIMTIKDSIKRVDVPRPAKQTDYTSLLKAIAGLGVAGLAYYNRNNIVDWLFGKGNLQVTKFDDRSLVNGIILQMVKSLPDDQIAKLPSLEYKYNPNNILTIDMIKNNPDSRVSFDPITSSLGYEQFSLNSDKLKSILNSE